MPVSNEGVEPNPTATVMEPPNVSPTRRRRILLGVLFHMYARRQRSRRQSRSAAFDAAQLFDRDSSSSSSSNSSSDNDRSLRTLKETDEEFHKALCRICFEGNDPLEMTTTTSGIESPNTDNADSMSADTDVHGVRASGSHGCGTTQQDRTDEDLVVRRTVTNDEDNDSESSENGDGGSHQIALSQDQLVAPCRCTGSSEWVHVKCLRQWQRQAMMQAQYRHAQRCNVCTSRFLIPPPQIRPRDVTPHLKPGSLLVMKEESAPTGSTFAQKVILMLRYDGVHSLSAPCGIIINEMLPEDSNRRVNFPSSPEDHGNSNSIEFEWRNGGPVCGGRFGVLRCIVIHSNSVTIYNPADSEQRYESRMIPLLGDEEEDEQDHQERRNHPQATLQVVCEEDDDDSIDDEVSLATLGGRELESFVKRLKASQTQRSDQGQSANASSLGTRGTDSDTSACPAKVMIFSGFCQWGTGQLEREIDRGVWGVVPNGTAEDVLWQDNGPSSGRIMWEQLSQSPRIVPSHDISD